MFQFKIGDLIYAEKWKTYGIVIKVWSPHHVYCDVLWLDQPITTRGLEVSSLVKVS